MILSDFNLFPAIKKLETKWVINVIKSFYLVRTINGKPNINFKATYAHLPQQITIANSNFSKNEFHQGKRRKIGFENAFLFPKNHWSVVFIMEFWPKYGSIIEIGSDFSQNNFVCGKFIIYLHWF